MLLGLCETAADVEIGEQIKERREVIAEVIEEALAEVVPPDER